MNVIEYAIILICIFDLLWIFNNIDIERVNDYQALCLYAGGESVQTRYDGYRCYDKRILIEGYENE